MPDIHNPKNNVFIIGPNGPVNLGPDEHDFGEGCCPRCTSKAVTLEDHFCNRCNLPIREWVLAAQGQARKGAMLRWLLFVLLPAMAVAATLAYHSISNMFNPKQSMPYALAASVFLLCVLMIIGMWVGERAARAVKLPQPKPLRPA